MADVDRKQIHRSVSYWEIENSTNIDKHGVHHRRIEELSAQLELTEYDRDGYKEECKKSQVLLSVLESEYEAAIDRLVELNKQHGDLLQAVDKLKPMNEELLHLEAKLAEARGKSELMENALNVEKEKEEELHIARAAVIQSVEQMIVLSDMITDLENKVMEKTVLSDYFQLELMQTMEKRMEEEHQIARNEPESLDFGNSEEVKTLKEELEAANSQISALRVAAEESVRRAQQAEKAKEAIEQQLRQWRKQQQLQRRATSERLHERKHGNLISNDGKISAYQPQHRSTSSPSQKTVSCVPLGKVLNMKF